MLPRICNSNTQNSSIRSDEGVTLETSAFQIFHGSNSTFINPFDKTKFSCFTLPQTQHHSFFLEIRNWFVCISERISRILRQPQLDNNNSVPHVHLILKIQQYGIRGQILEWLSDFLLERYQRVVLEGESSNWTKVSSGVPQESIVEGSNPGGHVLENSLLG